MHESITWSSGNNNNNGINVSNGSNVINNGVTIKAERRRNGASAKIQMPPAKEERLPCHYVAETNLPTDVGNFRMRAYRVNDCDHENFVKNRYVGSEPCVIYCPDKSPFINPNGGSVEDVPVRIHDQCFTSEVFRSKR